MKNSIVVVLVLILLAAIAFFVCAEANKNKKQAQQAQEENPEDNFSGLIDGAASIASSAVLLGIVLVGTVIVVGLVLIKKSSENPDRAFEIAGKAADLRQKFK